MKSKADNTVKKYKSGFTQWRKWCKNFDGISVIPANDFSISLFLVSLIQTSCHYSKIEEIVFSLSWCHKMAGFTDPCKSFLVQSIRSSAKRLLSRPVNKKEPITPAILEKLVDKYGHSECSLIDLRLLTMCLIGYAGFFRFSELVNIRLSDINFQENCVSIFVPCSKTDKYRSGCSVIIAATNTKTCPVLMLKRFLNMCCISNSNSDFYIFCQVSYCKNSNSYKLRSANKKLSYTRAREILLDALQSVDLECKRFGLHSLRSGGATSAASAGVSDRLFKKHGRWKSDSAKDGYVRESRSNLMSVSQNLGI